MIDFTSLIDKTWTLFLDRDGVLNIEKNGDYIRNADEFVLYNNTLESIAKLNTLFGKIIIVTNQRGVGKGLMTSNDVIQIHAHLDNLLAPVGGQIHAYYFAPDLDPNAPHRKPNTGMGLQAKLDFPDIDFSKSIMIGNNLSDMEFGKRLGMYTMYVETTKPLDMPNELVDLKMDSLTACCNAFLQHGNK